MSEPFTTLWVIFRDPNTQFTDLDKYVYQLVDDANILAYQTMLATTQKGEAEPFLSIVPFIQPFVRTDNCMYYVRRYTLWVNKET